jgi:flagellar assembly protein FliH
MEKTAPRKFMFDTVFDHGRVIEPVRPRRAFTAEEVEVIRAEAFAEGERSAVALAEAEAAAAEEAIAAHLAELAETTRAACAHLATLAVQHKTDAAALALALARKIADAALDSFPHAPLEAALGALAAEISTEPRLMVRVDPACADRVDESLKALAEHLGLPCQILVRTDPALARAAFSFDWGDGRARFDPVETDAALARALEEALAAEAQDARADTTLEVSDE